MRQITFGSLLFPEALTLCLASAGASAGQDPCLPSPLYSGNTVVKMPLSTGQVGVSETAESHVIDDFDEDGNLDLIFGSQYGNLVYFHGRTNWWDFDAPMVTHLPFATPPEGEQWQIESLATADFNHDGDLDLAIGENRNSAGPFIQRIHVMLGNGDGTFQPAVAYGPNIQFVRAIAIADLNGDGELDLMCPVRRTYVAVLWGAGNGTFPTFSQVEVSPAGPYSDGVSVADIDHDNDMDAVVDNTQGTDVLLRNNGNGTFTVETFALSFAFGYTFGELNGDGWADMVAGPVAVLLNDGTGHFPGFVDYPIASQPNVSAGSAPLVTDLDGDGRGEVVIERQGLCGAVEFHDQVLVFRNAGDGTLQQPPDLYHNTGDRFLSGALTDVDLNDDGFRDLIAVNQLKTTLLINDGTGGFLTPHATPMGPSVQGGNCSNSALTRLFYVQSGDVNNDGRFDLVAVRDNNSSILDCVIMLQDAQGAFTSVTYVPLVEHFVQGLAIADFNLDGKLDLSICSYRFPDLQNGVRVSLGNGNGTFGPWTLYHSAGNNPRHITARDVNGDNYPDLMTADQYGNNVSVLSNNLDGTFAAAVSYACGSQPLFVAVDDLNGDGHPDLAVAKYDSRVAVLLNHGDGTFGSAVTYAANPVQGYQLAAELALADVNGDTMADIIVATQWTFTHPSVSGGFAVLLNNGQGQFQNPILCDLGTEFFYPTVADLNGDGDKDLVTVYPGSGPSTGTTKINHGHGDGTFDPGIVYGGGGNARPIIADFDDDGRLDIASPMGSSPDNDMNTTLGFAILYNRMCPAPDPCPADIAPVGTPDGVVNVNDLLLVIGNWGAVAPPANPADVDGDGVVNVNDLLAVIGTWGPCP